MLLNRLGERTSLFAGLPACRAPAALICLLVPTNLKHTTAYSMEESKLISSTKEYTQPTCFVDSPPSAVSKNECYLQYFSKWNMFSKMTVDNEKFYVLISAVVRFSTLLLRVSLRALKCSLASIIFQIKSINIQRSYKYSLGSDFYFSNLV